MIDLHCHILPRIDDGANSLEETLAMARIAQKDGIRAIVATPHTLNGVYTNPMSRITSLVDAIQAVLRENKIDVALYPGADVHICPHLVERVKSGEAGTVNNTGKYVLLEFPSETVPLGARDEIFALKIAGITPIITHPERNAMIQRDPEILYELVSLGALGQVTAMSLTGDFGHYVARSAETLVKRRLVHNITTDAHSSETRPPILSRAVARAAKILKSKDEARRMVTEIPAAILSGDSIDVPEPRPRKR
jgi:protein-tyrosine phosphatase